MTEPVDGIPPPLVESQPDRWTPTEQLAVVALTHLAIAAFVTVVVVCGGGQTSPGSLWIFYVMEASIVVGCGWPWINPETWAAVSKLGKPKRKPPRDRKALVAKIAVWTLRAAFALQLIALVPLFHQTGGPVESPFAPMAVAIAIFTPFLTNYIRTIGVVALVTGLYYLCLVGFMDDLHKSWAHLAVSLSILTLASRLTAFDLSRREPEQTADT